MNKKMRIEEIVPAKDILTGNLENVKGGEGINVCLKGCITGEKSDKDKDKGKDNEPTPTTPSPIPTTPTKPGTEQQGPATSSQQGK